MAGSGAGRAMIAPLALLNFCMFMIVNGIAGWALNRLIDRSLGQKIYIIFPILLALKKVYRNLLYLIRLSGCSNSCSFLSCNLHSLFMRFLNHQKFTSCGTWWNYQYGCKFMLLLSNVICTLLFYIRLKKTKFTNCGTCENLQVMRVERWPRLIRWAGMGRPSSCWYSHS